MPATPPHELQYICNVWTRNLGEEMIKLQEIAQSYNYLSLDTQFPGTVAYPRGRFRTLADYHYQKMRYNVDLLNIIQLSLTLMNKDGEFPPGTRTWQFNFEFNLKKDMYSKDSIPLLKKSGIKFKKHKSKGIPMKYFGDVLKTSGLLNSDTMKWISFHSCHDFGYLVKLLTNDLLPAKLEGFFQAIKDFFPTVYDIKHLMGSWRDLKGGLQDLVDHLELPRIGQQHHSGSNSMLVGMVFFRMKELYFENQIDEQKYSGRLYNLVPGPTEPQNATSSEDEEKNNK